MAAGPDYMFLVTCALGKQLHFSTQLSGIPLKDRLPRYGKKWFKKAGMECKFCLKKGHTRSFCPAAPYDPPAENKLPFVEKLLAMPRVKTNIFNGMTPEGLLQWVERKGSAWNEGNPWVASEKIYDRLRAKLGYWRAIGASDSVISWLGYGVPMPFVQEPKHLVFKNHIMTPPMADYVSKDLEKHLGSGCFVVAGEGTVKVCNPILVIEQGEKLRRCDDCRFGNAYMASPKFKMASLKRDVPTVVSEGEVQITEDLEKAYYKIPLAKEAQPFLSFFWKGLYYLSMVMLFGMCQAPFFFTMICKPIVRVFGVLRIPALAYIDDWLWSMPPERLHPTRAFILNIFNTLGWSFNDKGQEGTRVEFLGFIMDSVKRMFFIRELKVNVLEAQLRELHLASGIGMVVDKKAVQMAVGRAISVSLAIPAVRVWCRALYAQLYEDEAAVTVLLSMESARELSVLLSLLHTSNGFPFLDPAHDLELWVDRGMGGHVVHGARAEGSVQCA